MKKILFATAALGLGLGFAASIASAEMSFTATGKYEVQGFYVSEGSDSAQGMQAGVFDKNLRWTEIASTSASCDGAIIDASELPNGKIYCLNGYDTATNDMWHHSLYIFPKLQVNDNIALNGEIRMIDRDVWGSNSATGTINTASYENMRLRLLWMDYMSPIGKWQFGRVLGGGWGTKFLDTTGNRDRIKWYPNFMPENFSMLLLYQKGAEKDAFDGSTDEADVASYYAGITWKGFGQTDLAVWHNRFDDDYSALGSYSNTEIWYAGNYMLGPVKLVGEINYGFGDDGGTAGALSTPSADIDSWGIMADASMQFDAFTIGGLFFWLTGDVDPDGDNKGYIGRNGVGNDWNPFAIATGDYMGLLNGDKNGYLGAVSAVIGIPQDEVTDPDVYSAGNGMNPGAMALAAYAGFQFNEKLSFNAAAGYIWADETWEGIDDAMGFEVDLGLSYKLLDNLTYSATFGYMVPGDMFDDIASSINDAFGDSLGTTGTNNIYLLLHNLTMTF